MMGITDGMRALKRVGWEKIEEWNRVLDDESIRRYIDKICKEDGVTPEEAWRLVQNEPKYSMGYKMCSPAIVMMLKSKKGQDRFREMLTPEELEIFNAEVADKINFRKAIRHELKVQRKNDPCRGKGS